MALTTTTVQSSTQPEVTPNALGAGPAASVLSALVLAMLAAKTKRGRMAWLKLKLLWHAMKSGVKNLLKPQSVSTRTLIYILLALVFIILLIIDPIIALVLAVVALILILAGVI